MTKRKERSQFLGIHRWKDWMTPRSNRGKWFAEFRHPVTGYIVRSFGWTPLDAIILGLRQLDG